MNTRFTIESAGRPTRNTDSIYNAVGIAAAYLSIGEASYIYCEGKVIAEVARESADRFVWTLTADRELWDARGALPAGHLHTHDSVRPISLRTRDSRQNLKSMNTREKLARFKIAPGDIVVDVVGSEVRFWSVVEQGEKVKVKMVAKSATFMRERFVHYMERGKSPIPGGHLTVARVFNGKDAFAGAKLVLDLFPEAPTVHLYYSGHGPSGNMWGFYPDRSHYSVRRVSV